MITSRALCANTGVFLIGLPGTEPIDVRAHQCRPARGTSASTPSPYCVDRRKRLEFYRLIDVKTFEELFDDPVNDADTTTVYIRSSTLLASQVPHGVYPEHNKRFIRDEEQPTWPLRHQTLGSSILVKDMP